MASVIAAEDEPAIQQILRIILERAGHSVTIIADGGDVLDAITAHQPDLVLLDIGLPTLNGLDICRALRADSITRNLPIGVVSGQVTPPFATELAAGATAVLTKPFVRDQLLQLVDDLLSTRAP
jgi:CheY-like chemotaxis protein